MRHWIKDCCRDGAWAPLLLLLLYLIAAIGFDAYAAYRWLDLPTHFLGGAAMAHFFRVSLSHGQRIAGKIPYPVQLIAAFGLTTMAAVGWEFFEFLSDNLFGTRMNHGVADTMADLLFGMLGGLAVIAASALLAGKKPARPHTAARRL